MMRIGKNNAIKAEYKTLVSKEYFGLSSKICAFFNVVSFIYYGVVYILPQTIESSLNINNMNNITNLTDLNNTITNNTVDISPDDINTPTIRVKCITGLILSALSEIPSTFFTGYLANINIFRKNQINGPRFFVDTCIISCFALGFLVFFQFLRHY